MDRNAVNFFRTLYSTTESLENVHDSARRLNEQVATLSAWHRLNDADRAQVRATLEKLQQNQPLEAPEQGALEAIILPGLRPVANIRGGKIEGLPDGEFKKALLDQSDVKAKLEAALASVGCILVPDSPQYPYAGTGFVVGKNLVMTNRHVAQLFASGLGTKGVKMFQRANFTPNREEEDQNEPSFTVSKVLMIHPYWDMALLQVDGLDLPALTLQSAPTNEAKLIAVVGYPAFDPRNAATVQQQVFNNRFYVKRLAPGYLRGVHPIDSFGKSVRAQTHDASTLGGNSGSAVIDAQTGEVIALHFAGLYLKNNYAVPMAELARDRRVVDLGISFTQAKPDAKTEWDSYWSANEDTPQPAPVAPVQPVTLQAPAPSTGEITLRIPIELSIRVGQVTTVATTVTAVTTAPVTPPSSSLPPELARLVEDGQQRSYYDATQDQADRNSYYTGIDLGDPNGLFASLSQLLKRTHTRTLPYKPATHLYPWVDLRPDDKKIQSIYSAKAFDPEELIRMDLEADRQRAEQIASRQESTPEGLLSLEEAVEASFPYNCEHVVPQSWFNKREPMRGDLHHLFACEVKCNSFRGNHSYQSFSEEKVMDDCGRQEGNNFEPKAGKGPVARATLYFLLRYPNEINAPNEMSAAQVSMLVRWAKQDPPGLYEKHRNQAIFGMQGNRNPLIDFPELLDRLDFSLGLG